MALSEALFSLKHFVRFNVSASTNLRLTEPLGRLPSVMRGFATSTYLDKSQVTDRVLEVVKNFDKVDKAKVGITHMLHLLKSVCAHELLLFVQQQG